MPFSQNTRVKERNLTGACGTVRKRTAGSFPTLFVAARVGGDSVRRIRTGQESQQRSDP
jgi:hypothetical protein